MVVPAAIPEMATEESTVPGADALTVTRVVPSVMDCTVCAVAGETLEINAQLAAAKSHWPRMFSHLLLF